MLQTDVNELCGSAESLAQQLTHIELERLSYIGPEEFVQAFAKESPALETSFKDMKQTRNLESYVSWFNRLSYFVATEVCKVRQLSPLFPSPPLSPPIYFSFFPSWKVRYTKAPISLARWIYKITSVLQSDVPV